MAEASILILLSFLALVYAGYPLLLIALAVAAPRRTGGQAGPAPASVSIIICAHNEARAIGAKLRSVLASVAGRPEQVEIIVCDDGSTDDTAAIAADIARGTAVPFRLMTLPRGG